MSEILGGFGARNIYALILAFVFSMATLSGTGSAFNITTNIGSVYGGVISNIEHPYYNFLYRSMSIRVAFKNTGSVTYQSTITFDVLNYSGTLLASYTDTLQTYMPGQERSLNATFIPDRYGYHYVRARASYIVGQSEAWSSFYVEPITVPTTYNITGPTGGGGGGGADLFVGIPKMRVNYTSKINVSRGQEYLIYLVVDNIGDAYGNISLDNIILYAKSMDIPFTVVPEKIHTLGTNESGFFLITLKVPEDIDAGDYVLDFVVISDETQKSGKVFITVIDLPVEDDIWSIIQNYLFIIERLKMEIRDAVNDGANTSISQYYLDLSIEAVDNAINLYNNEDFDAARSVLTTAREYLERCVLELALARADLLRIVLPAFVSLLLIILIIVAILTALFFFYTRRRKKEREKKQKAKAS